MHNELSSRMPFSLYMNAAIENFKFHKMALAVIHVVVSNLNAFDYKRINTPGNKFTQKRKEKKMSFSRSEWKKEEQYEPRCDIVQQQQQQKLVFTSPPLHGIDSLRMHTRNTSLQNQNSKLFSGFFLSTRRCLVFTFDAAQVER